MKTDETETQDERIHRTVHNLAVLAKEQKRYMGERKQLCLSAIEFLLGNSDYMCEDFIQHLKEEKGILKGGLALDVLDAREAADEQVDECLDEQLLKEKYSEKTIDYVLDKIGLIFNGFAPKFQQDVLVFLQSELPEKIREQQEEDAYDEVVDELINFFSELPITEQTEKYKGLLEQVRNGEALAVA